MTYYTNFDNIYSEENVMKRETFENIYNKERFYKEGKTQSKIIDGVLYLELCKEENKRKVFVRKDFLKKVNTK